MKINGSCNVCLIVMEIYGTVESVVPWLCECGKISAQSSLPVRHHRKVRIMGGTIRCHFGCCNPQDGFDDCLFKDV